MASQINPPRDPNTLSNYNKFLTVYTIINFEIDFRKCILSGDVALTLKSITDAATKEILLDTSYLDVQNVTVNGRTLKWELLPRFEPYGSALRINLETGVDKGKTVEVNVG